ncbi:hypothetical protein JHK82_013316 [Glycine max]|nr:hypothetical protein JHK82_013316 [Glycine max]
MNLKEIVLRSNLYGNRDASICFKGHGYVTAKDIILPPYVKIIDITQHIINITNYGYHMKILKNFQDGGHPIDVIFMHVRNVNHSMYSYVNGNEKLLESINCRD